MACLKGVCTHVFSYVLIVSDEPWHDMVVSVNTLHDAVTIVNLQLHSMLLAVAF